jgi:hypothetical protein
LPAVMLGQRLAHELFHRAATERRYFFAAARKARFGSLAFSSL